MRRGQPTLEGASHMKTGRITFPGRGTESAKALRGE